MPATRMGSETGRIPYIDGLRAIAVLVVVVDHATIHFPRLPATISFFSIQHLLLEGSHGVDLFFVLSGFCLSYPILQRIRVSGTTEFNIYRYFAKRIVRIVPSYYAAILLFTFTGLGMAPFNALNFVKQILFLDLHTSFVNWSFWTLYVEFRWYFFFPIAILLWTRAPRAFLALVGAAALAYNLTILHYSTDVATLTPFMLGIVAADIKLNDLPIAHWMKAVIPVALLCGIFFEFIRATDSTFFVQTNPGWQTIAFCLVVASARPTLRQILSWRPLVMIGTASYSIYLIHEPILVFVYSHWQAGPLLAPTAVATSIGAGMAFWFVWDRIWMSGRLKKRAIQWGETACAFAGKHLQIPQSLILKRPRVASIALKPELTQQRPMLAMSVK